jgi:hypothetical protein
VMPETSTIFSMHAGNMKFIAQVEE